MKIGWNPRDLWIGAFWDDEKRVLYVCIVPTIVISYTFGTKVRYGSG